jgi:hypothetical protein
MFNGEYLFANFCMGSGGYSADYLRSIGSSFNASGGIGAGLSNTGSVISESKSGPGYGYGRD